jgi:NAD(P)H-flavin reductase
MIEYRKADKERRKAMSMPEKPKRKTHTSSTVKRRYNDKTYSRVYADLPKKLVADFRQSVTEQGVSMSSILQRAVEQFVDSYPPKDAE